ncbi:hypothetical protein BRADI_1g19142v3 [Brachypodium distachyon]|uniref:Uncharacterized protein n=1 Tax=Brachypodium distachyon TaxID=15368 RepID=A0A0Q3GWM7_BRADI|nr:hypothetical protein BRADI_1g19142v3 [Brachypodium distachyon]
MTSCKDVPDCNFIHAAIQCRKYEHMLIQFV